MLQRIAFLAWIVTSSFAWGCGAVGDVFDDDPPPAEFLATHRYAGFSADGGLVAEGALDLRPPAQYATCVGRFMVALAPGVPEPAGHFLGEGLICPDTSEPSIPERYVWVVASPSNMGIEKEQWTLTGLGLGYPASGGWERWRSGTAFETGTFEIVPVDLPGR
ncbi:MAG TPA: hypothetical protein VF139_03440 [Candidatus Polarisedimenticolaceae bacterium]